MGWLGSDAMAKLKDLLLCNIWSSLQGNCEAICETALLINNWPVEVLQYETILMQQNFRTLTMEKSVAAAANRTIFESGQRLITFSNKIRVNKKSKQNPYKPATIYTSMNTYWNIFFTVNVTTFCVFYIHCLHYFYTSSRVSDGIQTMSGIVRCDFIGSKDLSMESQGWYQSRVRALD